MNDQSLTERAAESTQRPAYWRDARDMLISTAEGDFENAFFELQCELDAIIEADSKNPHFKSDFASFPNTLATIRNLCREHGFTIRQFAGKLNGHGGETRRFYTLPVCTKITHKDSRQFEMVIVDIPVDQKAVSIGAALTFGKRYALQSYFGIASADSDSMTFIQEQFDMKDAEETAQFLIDQLEETETVDDLDKWLKKNEQGLKMYSEAVLTIVRNAFAAHLNLLKKQEEKPKANGKSKKEPEANAPNQ